MKSKIVIPCSFFILIALSGQAQVTPVTIEIKNDSKLTELAGIENNYDLTLINKTGKTVKLITCSEITLKAQDNLFIKYNSTQKELIVPKIKMKCKNLMVKWKFDQETKMHELCRIDTVVNPKVGEPAAADAAAAPAAAPAAAAAAAAAAAKQPDHKISFLPTAQFVQGMKQSLKYDQSSAVNNMVQYRIVCNVAGGEIQYFKNTTQIESKKVHPTVGQEIQVVFKNFNPYSDSTYISYNFIDNNLELSEKFATLANTFMQSEQAKKTDTGEEAKAKSQTYVEFSVKDLETFAKEMKSFYIEKSKLPSIDPDYLAACIGEININICNIFNITDNNPATINEKVLPIIDSVKSVPEREKYRALLQTGLYYYEKIITFKSSTHFPIQIENADEMDLRISFYRNNKLNETWPHKFYNRGGFKMDFSAGIFGTSLINKNYTTKVVQCYDTVYYKHNFIQTDSIVRIDTSNKNQIILDDLGKFTVGIGLLAHFYFRTSTWFNVALNTGFMIDNNISTNYLFGISFLLGHNARFNINAGGVVGKVRRLASGLEVGQFYDSGPSQVQTVPTKDVWKCGWYIGITYNFITITPKQKKTN
jgi:hypothetical protein